MKKLKKGFTIVELVIVIAVIAILAGVLIPVFSNVVDKANLSADKQTVRQMNVALATEDKATTYNEMADVLYAHGYNVKERNVAAPASKGNKYYWSVEHNTIVLVKDNKVVFPEDSKYDSFDIENEEKWMKIDAGNYVVISVATDADVAKEEIEVAIAGGNSFKLAEKIDEGIKLDNIGVAKSIEVDLAGTKITTSIRKGNNETAQNDYAFTVTGGATLTIKNAEIEARGIQVNDGTVIVEEGVNIVCNGTNGGAAIWATGKNVKVVINGGDFTAMNEPEKGITELNNASTAITIRDGATCIINNATITNEKTIVYTVNAVNGSVEINNSTIKGIAGIASAGSSNVILNNCNIDIDSTKDGVGSRHVLYTSGTSTITVNNCTITAKLGAAGCSVQSSSDGGTITIDNQTTISVN